MRFLSLGRSADGLHRLAANLIIDQWLKGEMREEIEIHRLAVSEIQRDRSAAVQHEGVLIGVSEVWPQRALRGRKDVEPRESTQDSFLLGKVGMA